MTHSTSRPLRRFAPIGALLLLLALAAIIFAAAQSNSAPDESDAVNATAGAQPVADGLAAADRNGDGIVYQSGMHPHVVQDEPGQCPICGMDLTPVRVGGTESGVIRIDPVTTQNIGVRTATVMIESVGRSVRTTGRFEASEQGRSAVSPRIGGWVEELFVDYEGARVQKGQPLLTIYSPELVSTQEEYLLALRHAERMGNTPDAQRLVDAARRRLAYWEVSEEQIARLHATGVPQRTVTLHARSSGTVVSKNVVQGQQVMPGTTLLELSDLSRLWLMVDVYEQDLSWVGTGTVAQIALPYEPGRTIEGRIDYVYDTLDPQMRTARARVTLSNPALELKPGMYAAVTLVGGNAAPVPVIPEEALIPTSTGGVVLLALGEGRFQPVEVLPGSSSGGRVQILHGLSGGEKVVTSAQFLIDSEARLQRAVASMTAGHDHAVPSASPSGAPDGHAH